MASFAASRAAFQITSADALLAFTAVSFSLHHFSKARWSWLGRSAGGVIGAKKVIELSNSREPLIVAGRPSCRNGADLYVLPLVTEQGRCLSASDCSIGSQPFDSEFFSGFSPGASSG